MTNDQWYPVADGATLGETGSEDGLIIRDEEHAHGARITLERGGSTAPFSITCGVYGAMFHTCFFGDEAEGQEAYGRMKPGLASIAGSDAADAPEAAAAFVAQFP